MVLKALKQFGPQLPKVGHVTSENDRELRINLINSKSESLNGTGPTDAKQLLIWVVTDSESETGKKEIRITTRQAAERENYTVPNEFTIDPS